MKIFLGKISGEHHTKQIEEGYYKASKDSTHYTGADVDHYVFIIEGNRIQLCKALKWY